MRCITKLVSTRPSLAILIPRVVIGIIFIIAGVMKFQNITATAGFFGAIHIPFPVFSAWLVAIVEAVGGLALALGVMTQVAAGLLAITMVVAMVTVTGKLGLSGGFGYTLVIFTSLVSIILSGAGKYAVEARCKCPMCPAPKGCSDCDCSTGDTCKVDAPKQ